jgi:hypothetical protein
MKFARRLSKYAVVLALVAVMVSFFAISTVDAKPKKGDDCLCCMPVPFEPFIVCWDCCSEW